MKSSAFTNHEHNYVKGIDKPFQSLQCEWASLTRKFWILAWWWVRVTNFEIRPWLVPTSPNEDWNHYDNHFEDFDEYHGMAGYVQSIVQALSFQIFFSFIERNNVSQGMNTCNSLLFRYSCHDLFQQGI